MKDYLEYEPDHRFLSMDDLIGFCIDIFAVIGMVSTMFAVGLWAGGFWQFTGWFK